MSALLDLQEDPYLLPLPLPETAVISPRWVVAHAHLNGRFADESWSWAPLIENPSTSLCTTDWSACPQPLRGQVKSVAWALANGKLRPAFVKTQGTKFKARLGPVSILQTVQFWLEFARWLDARDVVRLDACTSDVLHEYGLVVRESGYAPVTAGAHLRALTRLWAYDQLLVRPTGFGRPPWVEVGMLQEYLPRAAFGTSSGENSTEPLNESTIGPLLCWAIRMVEEFAQDILAAAAEARRIKELAEATAATPETAAALEAFLRPHIDFGVPLPAMWMWGRLTMGRSYVQAVTGASDAQVQAASDRYGLSAIAAGNPGPCPLPVPITGRIADRPWREFIDFYEAEALLRHLGTAAFVVIAYLTGMRPQEVLGMRSGCCPDPEGGNHEVTWRHLIYSHEYKTAVDDEGIQLTGGIEREVPWVAISTVVNAIRLLERMVAAGALLFDSATHGRGATPHTGSLKTQALTRRLADFITWANSEAARQYRQHEAIPPDPLGRVHPSRFRRTLAWHIARRPGGMFALAIQYGHLRTALEPVEVTGATGGYAARNRGGIHELIDIETVLATAETAAGLRDLFDSGGGVSGPAARAALQAAAATPRFEGQQVKADYARKYLAKDGQVLYDNPNTLLICRYKADQALCTRDTLAGKTAPSLERCVRGCGNTVRTDVHAAQLRERADKLEAEAAHCPGPLAGRLRAAADRARADADTHDETKTTKTGESQ